MRILSLIAVVLFVSSFGPPVRAGMEEDCLQHRDYDLKNDGCTAMIHSESLPFGEPVHGGRRTSGFGPRGRSMHSGLDIAAPRGTPIYSTADGVVTLAGRQRGYGILVKIRHAFGFETVYAHLSRARVKMGQRVGRGDRIGDMGSTGRSTGNHLHYEIRIDNEPVNPVKFIEAARDVL